MTNELLTKLNQLITELDKLSFQFILLEKYDDAIAVDTITDKLEELKESNWP